MPDSRVLILTTFDADEYVVEALRAGASGFVLKDVPPDDFAEAIRTIAAGDALLAPSVTRQLLDRFRDRLPAPPGESDARLRELTDRELEVLKLVARGLSNREIADRLVLAEPTVKTHVSHMLLQARPARSRPGGRARLRSRAGPARFARRLSARPPGTSNVQPARRREPRSTG